jgi:tetratricopeptide (TPR) repeat protein
MEVGPRRAEADGTESGGAEITRLCRTLIPLAAAGDHAEAASTYRWVTRASAGTPHRYGDHALRLEFCALTGNEHTGIDLLSLLDGVGDHADAVDRLEFFTASAQLTRRLTETGYGEVRFTLDGPYDGLLLRQLHQRMRAAALVEAEELDKREHTGRFTEYARRKMAAKPVAEFVPLLPSALPRVPILPPPDLTAEELVLRAEIHNHRCEPEEARACLAAIDTVTDAIAPRLTELRAIFFQGGDTEERLRRAAAGFRRRGDEVRFLLNQCWLGLWLVFDDQAETGVALTTVAAARLRAGTDDGAACWAEYWLAHVLSGQGRTPEAYEALRRGAERAREAGDPLLLGTLLCLEATLRNGDGEDPAVTVELARAATDAFIVGNVGEKAIEAVEQVRIGYERTGSLDELDLFVEHLLATLPVGGPEQLRGHLRQLRAMSLIGTGRFAEAVDDAYASLGVAVSRGKDTVEHWYVLVTALHGAGRYDEVLDVAPRTIGLLTGLPDWGQRCRWMYADAYRALGESSRAFDEYAVLAEILQEAGDTGHSYISASMAAAEQLDLLGHGANAADFYGRAAEAALAIGGGYVAATCRNAATLSRLRSGDLDAALAALAAAETAVHAVKTETAPVREHLVAQLDHVAAHVLSAVGRVREAARRALRAAETFHRIGEAESARDVDLLLEQILLGEA